MDVSVDDERIERVVGDVPVDEQECFVTLSRRCFRTAIIAFLGIWATYGQTVFSIGI